jgi:uncharacterized protein
MVPFSAILILMSEINKAIIRKLNASFEAGDADAILSCLAETIIWDVPPHFVAKGKQEFRAHITSPDADGPPVIELRNLVAEGNHVTVEGYVENKFKNGNLFKAVFHNAYELKDGLVVKMTSYVVPTP